MIPLAVPNLMGREKEYLNNCIDSTYVSSIGEYVTRLEEMTVNGCNFIRDNGASCDADCDRG